MSVQKQNKYINTYVWVKMPCMWVPYAISVLNMSGHLQRNFQNVYEVQSQKSVTYYILRHKLLCALFENLHKILQ